MLTIVLQKYTYCKYVVVPVGFHAHQSTKTALVKVYNDMHITGAQSTKPQRINRFMF